MTAGPSPQGQLISSSPRPPACGNAAACVRCRLKPQSARPAVSDSVSDEEKTAAKAAFRSQSAQPDREIRPLPNYTKRPIPHSARGTAVLNTRGFLHWRLADAGHRTRGKTRHRPASATLHKRRNQVSALAMVLFAQNRHSNRRVTSRVLRRHDATRA